MIAPSLGRQNGLNARSPRVQSQRTNRLKCVLAVEGSTCAADVGEESDEDVPGSAQTKAAIAGGIAQNRSETLGCATIDAFNLET